MRQESDPFIWQTLHMGKLGTGGNTAISQLPQSPSNRWPQASAGSNGGLPAAWWNTRHTLEFTRSDCAVLAMRCCAWCTTLRMSTHEFDALGRAGMRASCSGALMARSPRRSRRSVCPAATAVCLSVLRFSPPVGAALPSASAGGPQRLRLSRAKRTLTLSGGRWARKAGYSGVRSMTVLVVESMLV